MKKKIKILLISLSVIVNILLIYRYISINPYDVNLDGKVNSQDLLELKRYLLR